MCAVILKTAAVLMWTVQVIERKHTKAVSDEKFLFTVKVMAELGKLGFEAHFLDLKSGRARHAWGH